MTVRSRLFCITLLLCGGCRSTTDPLEVAGISMAEDEVFRQTEYPSADPDQVYQVARRLLRTHFAGGPVIEDQSRRTIEVPPRGFTGAPRRVQVFLNVLEQVGGAKVEIFCKVDQLRGDLLSNPEAPWEFIGRDAELENLILHEIWDAVMVAPLEGG